MTQIELILKVIIYQVEVNYYSVNYKHKQEDKKIKNSGRY